MWHDFDERERASPEAIERLLSSRWPGDLHRALWEIERRRPESAHLALALIDHADERLRARAAAVVAGDESGMANVLPLVRDPSPVVRKAARVALLQHPDVAIARRALLGLLTERSTEVARDGQAEVHARTTRGSRTGRTGTPRPSLSDGRGDSADARIAATRLLRVFPRSTATRHARHGCDRQENPRPAQHRTWNTVTPCRSWPYCQRTERLDHRS